jgi:hypothetical protein
MTAKLKETKLAAIPPENNLGQRTEYGSYTSRKELRAKKRRWQLNQINKADS